jgi:hypothetical protein
VFRTIMLGQALQSAEARSNLPTIMMKGFATAKVKEQGIATLINVNKIKSPLSATSSNNNFTSVAASAKGSRFIDRLRSV